MHSFTLKKQSPSFKMMPDNDKRYIEETDPILCVYVQMIHDNDDT
jgi:hypothetical protein